MDGLADCYTLSPDKPALVQSDWVKKLCDDSMASCAKAAEDGEWFKARRIYSNLSILQPTESKWTKAAEDMYRRVRILGRYSPDVIADVLKKELDYRKEARKYLVASTQPAAAATQPEEKTETSDQLSQNLKTDWKAELNGVHMAMLREALQDAQLNYYKDTKYDQLLTGGLKALRTIATTQGMDKAFPGLNDPVKTQSFVSFIDDQLKSLADRPADQDTLSTVLSFASTANKQTIELPDEVLVSEFADGAFGTLDPFSSMIWPSDMEEFRTTTQGEFSGIGVQIQELDGMIKVISPIEDSPALKAGLRAGDVITRIDGKSAKGITSLQAKRMITGMTGTNVVITVRSPDDKVVDYTITRQTIKVSSIKGFTHTPGGGWDYTIDPDQKIAYVRLSNFTKESANDLAARLTRSRRTVLRR
ncbi:MAG: PDZ domain-containing protein [Tepidisphaeraceae bacterium]